MKTAIALHVSAWVEIPFFLCKAHRTPIALHVSAWIEMSKGGFAAIYYGVALHVSAWKEIYANVELEFCSSFNERRLIHLQVQR